MGVGGVHVVAAEPLPCGLEDHSRLRLDQLPLDLIESTNHNQIRFRSAQVSQPASHEKTAAKAQFVRRKTVQRHRAWHDVCSLPTYDVSLIFQIGSIIVIILCSDSCLLRYLHISYPTKEYVLQCTLTMSTPGV